MGYFIHASYLACIFNKTVLSYLSHSSRIYRGAVRIYRGVTSICRMLSYLSFVLLFNVVSHPIGRVSNVKWRGSFGFNLYIFTPGSMKHYSEESRCACLVLRGMKWLLRIKCIVSDMRHVSFNTSFEFHFIWSRDLTVHLTMSIWGQTLIEKHSSSSSDLCNFFFGWMTKEEREN